MASLANIIAEAASRAVVDNPVRMERAGHLAGAVAIAIASAIVLSVGISFVILAIYFAFVEHGLRSSISALYAAGCGLVFSAILALISAKVAKYAKCVKKRALSIGGLANAFYNGITTPKRF